MNPDDGRRSVLECLGVASCAVAATLLVAGAGQAQEPKLKPELAGVGFLLGHWTSPTRGQVEDTGGTSLGTSSFTSEVGGSVMLRKDHVSLFDRTGAAAGGFDIIMMIYPEDGTLHAEYSDGTHVLHYRTADISPARQVTFATATTPGAPTFRLSYRLTAPKVLEIDFAMAAPGTSDFHPVATGEARKDD